MALLCHYLSSNGFARDEASRAFVSGPGGAQAAIFVWPVPARTPRAICILKMCIDDLERAGWGVGWHDLGALGVGRADGTRGPADRRGAPRVGERPANAGGLSGSLPTRVWGAGDPQHSAPIPFHTEGPCSHLDQTGQHRLSIMFDLLARS